MNADAYTYNSQIHYADLINAQHSDIILAILTDNKINSLLIKFYIHKLSHNNR